MLNNFFFFFHLNLLVQHKISSLRIPCPTLFCIVSSSLKLAIKGKLFYKKPEIIKSVQEWVSFNQANFICLKGRVKKD